MTAVVSVEGRSGIAGAAAEEVEEVLSVVVATALDMVDDDGPIGVEMALLAAPAPARSQGFGGETVAMVGR